MPLIKNKILLLSFILYCSANYAADTITVGNFSKNDLSHWDTQDFQNKTLYTLQTVKGQSVLKATSHNSASGLVKKTQIDLHKTPYINWRWRVDHSLYRLAEDFKQGDDFAARIYVIVDGGIFFWKTLALNYVWASNKQAGEMWDNPFTANAKMIAIESGDQHAGQWISEKRNVWQDLQKAFQQDFRFIDAVAIMTDTDNSGQDATAYYGDIYFSSQ